MGPSAPWQPLRETEATDPGLLTTALGTGPRKSIHVGLLPIALSRFSEFPPGSWSRDQRTTERLRAHPRNPALLISLPKTITESTERSARGFIGQGRRAMVWTGAAVRPVPGSLA